VAHGVFVDVVKSSHVSWKGSKLLVDVVKSSHVSWKGSKLLVEVCCQFLTKKSFSMKRESICLDHA